MAKITWTFEAEQWLKDIHDYIAKDNPQAAVLVVEGIYERAQMLQDNPHLGYLYERFPRKRIRILLFGHYRIAYQAKIDRSIVILGVFHGALEIDKYLL